MDVGAATWPELAAGPRTLLVPLGATEQHGPHLPADTDTRIATAWAMAAASKDPLLGVAPALPYGSSGEHGDFPGTLSIGTDVLVSVLVELTRSAIPPHGHLVFVNGHGGNHEAVRRAVAHAQSEGRSVQAVWPTLSGADAHAGRTETSLMLAIAPELVRLDRAEPGNTTPIAELLPSLRADGLRAHTPNGVLGNPQGATAEEGKRLLNELVDQLLEKVSSS